MADTDDSLVMDNSSGEESLPAGVIGYAYSSEEPEAVESSESGPAVTPMSPLSPRSPMRTPVSEHDPYALLASPRTPQAQYHRGNPMFEDADLSLTLDREVYEPKKLPHVDHEADKKSAAEEQMEVEEEQLMDKARKRRRRITKHMEDVENLPQKNQKGMEEEVISAEDCELLDSDGEGSEEQRMPDPAVVKAIPEDPPKALEDFIAATTQGPDMPPDAAIETLTLLQRELNAEWAAITEYGMPCRDYTFAPIPADDKTMITRWFVDDTLEQLHSPRYLGVIRGKWSSVAVNHTHLMPAMDILGTEYSVFVGNERTLLKQGGPLVSCRRTVTIDEVVAQAVTARVNIVKYANADLISESLHDQFYNNFYDVKHCDWESYHTLRRQIIKTAERDALMIGAKEDITPLQTILMHLCRYGYGAYNILPPAAIASSRRWSEQYAVKLNLGATFCNWILPVSPPWVTYGRAKLTDSSVFFIVICSSIRGGTNMYKLRVITPYESIVQHVCSCLVPLIPGSCRVDRVKAKLTEKNCFRFVIGACFKIQIRDEDFDKNLYGRLLPYVTKWTNPIEPRRDAEIIEEAKWYNVARRSARLDREKFCNVNYYMNKEWFQLWLDNTMDMFNIDKKAARALEGNATIDSVLSYVYDAVDTPVTQAVVVGFGADFTAWEGALGFIHRSFQRLFNVSIKDLAYAFGICGESKNGEGSAICDSPYQCPENIRHDGSWFMYFFGFENKEFVSCGELNGPVMSDSLMTAGYILRPAVIGMIPTTLELKKLSVNLAKSLRCVRGMGFHGPSDFINGVRSRNHPKSKKDLIHKCFREVAPGTPFDSAIDSMSLELQNEVSSSYNSWQTIFNRICPKEIMPDPVITPVPLPTHLLERNQLALVLWVAALKTSPHHNSNGRGLFLYGQTATGKSAFMAWLKHYFRVSVLSSSGGNFYQGVRPTDEVLVFDDVDDIHAFPDVLKLLDASTDFSVNVKFGTCTFAVTPRLVFITNREFAEYFFTKDTSQDVREALGRKITKVYLSQKTNVFEHTKYVYNDKQYIGKVATRGGVPAGLRWYTAPENVVAAVPNINELVTTIEKGRKGESTPANVNYNTLTTDVLIAFSDEDDLPMGKCMTGDDLLQLTFCPVEDETVVPEIAILEAIREKVNRGRSLDSDDAKLLTRIIPESGTGGLIVYYNQCMDDSSRTGILCVIDTKLRQLH